MLPPAAKSMVAYYTVAYSTSVLVKPLYLPSAPLSSLDISTLLYKTQLVPEILLKATA